MKKTLSLLLVVAALSAYALPKDIRVNFRLNYYMNEPQTELLVYLPDSTVYNNATILLTSPSGEKLTAKGTKGDIVSIPVNIASLPQGTTEFAYIVQADGVEKAGTAHLEKLPYKFNAVQVDRKTGGVVIRGLPFIPMGFFAYSPVQPMIQEEEVVRGFNMISPYQNIPRTDIKMRKVYLDRAAELGMKVNYNLLSVATGGTGFNKNQNTEERKAMLRREIEAFKDHPALLSWYLADEPDGRNTSPDSLRKLYELVRDLDPYHPVSIVFMHYGSERKYAGSYDISMGDLYPVPRSPVAQVSKFQKAMSDELLLEKGIWLVPQAFGGNEWWTREPTAAEVRAETYMGLLNGSTGFQYFIRHGQNGFPKSTTAWGEAGAVALELAELSPYVLSGEKAPKVAANDSMVDVRAWKRGDNLIVAAVNKENKAKDVTFTVEGWDYTGTVLVPFEDRVQEVKNGAISDKMIGLDTKVYKFSADKALAPSYDKRNVVVDGDFEFSPMPGVPMAVYAQVGKGRGSTYFTDSRTAHSGEHSVRLLTHKDGEGVVLQHFPMIVDSAHTYTISFWAKAASQEEFPLRKNYVNHRGKVKTEKLKPTQPTLHVTLRHLGKDLVNDKLVIDSPEWKRYTIDVYVQKQPGKGRDGLTLNFDLPTRSMIWLDDISFLPKE